jgi:glycosyltransferase involved in cell wall biosynthesis
MPELGLDYVSPLPPVRTGIADYSVDLLPHLEPLCDLRVVRVPGQPVAERIAERWRPIEAEHLGEPGRVALYHMGNNQHHLEIERLAMAHPGVVTIHDLVLHHFLLGKTVGDDDHQAYRRRMGVEHGWLGESASLAVRWGAWGESLQFTLPAHRRLIRRQFGVLVHSRWARGMVLEEEPDLDVRTVPMGIPLPPRVDLERGLAFRDRLGIPPDAPLLGAFGFQTPMKRPDVVIRAMGASALAAAHLIVAGEVAETLDLEAVAVEAGVTERVHVTGFLAYEEFEAAIAACDVCLNLRYPTAGETSAALLRTLALGRPTIVSDYAQFAELPSEAAIKIPVGEGEVEALVAAAETLLGDRRRLSAMGEAAREYVRREHDPATAARALVEACGDIARSEPTDRPVEVPPPTSMTWTALRGDLEVSGHQMPWPEGERRRLEVRLTNRSRARWLAGTRGPGGVVFQLTLEANDRNLLESAPWPALGRDLDPGETGSIEIEIRRPLGPARLRIEPHVLGNRSFVELGGPSWESEI